MIESRLEAEHPARKVQAAQIGQPARTRRSPLGVGLPAARIVLRLSVVLAAVVAGLAIASIAPQGYRQAVAQTTGTAYVLGGRLEKSEPPATTPSAYREIDWERLVPADWDPMKDFEKLDLGAMSDSDPRAMIALTQLQEAWKNAPVNPDLERTPVRISGFVVPLDNSRDGMKEFLLVPYFGACIHVPPPPSNQIIHVVPDKPLKGFAAMDAVWVSGTMTTARADTAMGSSSYRMSGDSIQAFAETSKGGKR